MVATEQPSTCCGAERGEETESEAEFADAFGGLRAADLLARGGAGPAPLPADASLQGAGEALVGSGQSALAVVAAGGGLAGIFTENDVLRAYFESSPPELSVGHWFDSGMARASAEELRRIVVRPQDLLADVSRKMVGNLLSGDCACHHVVVQGEEGRSCAVLSTLDLVHALCRRQSDAHPAFALPESKEPADLEPTSGAEEPTVWSLMKRRNDVFTCEPGSTVKEVLKVMLLSGQNSVLIADDHGVHGIVTPRDLLRAFVDGVRTESSVADLGPGVVDRLIGSHEGLPRALTVMKERGVNHLLVVRPRSTEVVGVLSSLDAVLSTQPRARRAYAPRAAVGPQVGDLVASHRHFTAVCSTGETLAAAARLLMTSSRSAAVVRNPAGEPLGLLTESDIARAFREGTPRDTLIQDWYLAREASQQSLQPFLVIRPSVRVTEAAALMTLMQSAADQGRGPCHHLVVQAPDGEWLGVCSALDVVRGVRGLRSELELSRAGADRADVAALMKRAVPTCRASDTVEEALDLLISSRQNCVLVEDEGGPRGVVTPRCALQAFAAGAPRGASVAACLSSLDGRQVRPDARLVDAALAMATRSFHHLVVRSSESEGALGVLSSLDLVRGVASINSQCPFVSLRWLGLCRGRECCMLHRP